MFSRLDQFLVLAFAQLAYRESLRDIQASLGAWSSKLYHMGIRGGVARNTLAHANERRDWRIYADFVSCLTAAARRLYADHDLGIELANMLYALTPRSSFVPVAVSLGAARQTKTAVKLPMLLDLRGNIPAFLHIADGTYHEVTFWTC